MNSNVEMMRKLQIALNNKGHRILTSRSQFYSEQQKRPVTIYKVQKAIFDKNTGKNHNVELYSAASTIRIVLFLRNLWFFVNDQPIPKTNEQGGGKEFDRQWKEFIDANADLFRNVD